MIRLFLLLFFTSCNLGPKLVGPVVPIPETWKETEVEETGVVATNDRWWEIFEDDVLNCLELEALAMSPDLETAFYRVEEAWAKAGVDKAALYPQLTLDPLYSNNGQLIRLYRPPGFVNFPDQPYRIQMLNYVLPLNLSYEIDLWGKLRNQAKAGCLTAEAARSAYKGALLELTTEVASVYFTLRTLEASSLIYQEEIKQRQDALNFFNSRYQKGIGQRLNVETAKIELSNTEAAYNAVLRDLSQQNNRLAALLGRAPEDFHLNPLIADVPPPQIPPGVPSDILINRPDISEAELKRAAENASVGAAWASFFPSFTLTGVLGYLSPTTQDFLKNISRYWGWGVAADQTLFDGFRKCENYQASWARFNQADASYRQIVLNAFMEVDDSLSSLRYEKVREENYKSAEEASLSALSLSKARFSRGIANRLEVIDNERSSLAARLNHLDATSARYQATVKLIRSLGASWGNCSNLVD